MGRHGQTDGLAIPSRRAGLPPPNAPPINPPKMGGMMGWPSVRPPNPPRPEGPSAQTPPPLPPNPPLASASFGHLRPPRPIHPSIAQSLHPPS